MPASIFYYTKLNLVFFAEATKMYTVLIFALCISAALAAPQVSPNEPRPLSTPVMAPVQRMENVDGGGVSVIKETKTIKEETVSSGGSSSSNGGSSMNGGGLISGGGSTKIIKTTNIIQEHSSNQQQQQQQIAADLASIVASSQMKESGGSSAAVASNIQNMLSGELQNAKRISIVIEQNQGGGLDSNNNNNKSFSDTSSSSMTSSSQFLSKSQQEQQNGQSFMPSFSTHEQQSMVQQQQSGEVMITPTAALPKLLALIRRMTSLMSAFESYDRGTGYPWMFGDPLSAKMMFERCERDHGVGNCIGWGSVVQPKCMQGYHDVGCCTCEIDVAEPCA